jgi:hypothetical protein
LQSAAAANNAEWCGLVCRTHGLETTVGEDAWTSPFRTPPYYPDAVTLVPDVAVPDLLARIDRSPGCSIKDSFASLDFEQPGFEVLFEAEWLARMPVSQPAPAPLDTWSVVTDIDTFAVWERAWRRYDEEGDVLRAGLLDVPAVTVMAELMDDQVIAGAVLNRSSDVVGISNFFAGSHHAAASWESCVAFVITLFPASVLVTYDAGPEVVAAPGHGWVNVGPLRVWLRPEI